MKETLLALSLAVLIVGEINSQDAINRHSWWLSYHGNELVSEAAYFPPAAMQYSEKPKIAFFVKAGPGISQIFNSDIEKATVRKQNWGFSMNFGAGLRFRLSKRSDLEFDFNMLQMKSKMKGYQYTTRAFGDGDTISNYNTDIRASWLNSQFALKFRYQPKKSLPLFINTGVDYKRRITNSSTQAQVITDIGEFTINQTTGEYQYKRLASPRTRRTKGEFFYQDITTGIILSLEYAPFQYYGPDNLSFELGINQAIPDAHEKITQRFLFVSAKYLFR